MANEPCIWTAASKSRLHTMARLRAGSGVTFGCSGTHRMSVYWIRSPANYYENTYANSAVAIASRTKSSRRGPLSKNQHCSPPPKKPGRHIGALCQACIGITDETAVRRILGVLALAKKYGVASTDEVCALGLETGVPNTTSCAVIWNVIRNCRQLAGPPAHPATDSVSDLIEKRTRRRRNNHGTSSNSTASVRPCASAAWRTFSKRACIRLRPKLWPPIDLISRLVSDELTRRGDRLLERRRKQAGFRDPDKSLHTFDFEVLIPKPIAV